MSNTALIPLKYKSAKLYYATVDEADLDFLIQFEPWNLSISANTFYAYSLKVVPGKAVLMHRLLLNITDSKTKTEHLDGNGLHNCRSNIAIKVKRENSFDRRVKKRYASQIKDGIFYCDFYCKYKVTVLYKNRTINVGYFESKLEAIKARKLKVASLAKLALKESLTLEDLLNNDPVNDKDSKFDAKNRILTLNDL